MTTTEGIDSAGTANLAFLEELFAQYQNDPESLSADWRQYFDSLVDLPERPPSNGHSSGGYAGSTNGSVPAVVAEKNEASTDDESASRAANSTQDSNGLLEDLSLIHI